ncbi:hypothetical protein BD413DRAFT_15068 [Trametes elegans]|nr:hypothetical protein BD413DRAFT_15068 [Trametes elegans]
MPLKISTMSTISSTRQWSSTVTHPRLVSSPNHFHRISAILVCRFLLDLRGVSEKLAGGSSGTVSSLDFGGVGSQIPPSNPSFLRGSLAGSAHSSPDVGEDEAAPTEHHEMAAAQGTSNSPIV